MGGPLRMTPGEALDKVLMAQLVVRLGLAGLVWRVPGIEPALLDAETGRQGHRGTAEVNGGFTGKEGAFMINFRESLMALATVNAEQALVGQGAFAGCEAIARLAFLMSLIDEVDASNGAWENCCLLPEMVPVSLGESLMAEGTVQ